MRSKKRTTHMAKTWTTQRMMKGLKAMLDEFTHLCGDKQAGRY